MVGMTLENRMLVCKTCDTCGKSFYYLVSRFGREDDRATAFFLLHQLTCREHRGAREIYEEEREVIEERHMAFHNAFCAWRRNTWDLSLFLCSENSW
jgi:hypothetical protein